MTSAVAVADGVAMPARDRAESAAAVRPRAWIATAVIAGIALAIFLAFVGYGFQLEDEGTVLYQILRTFRGERPYIDFHTGYTPAMFYLNAGLFRLFGVSVVPIRIVLALVNALAAALTFRLALRLAPPLEAAFAALAYAFCMPFFAGQFASFNIPYPAWYAVAAWLGAELASMRAIEGGGRRWLAVAGVLAGVAFSFKPNTGVLCLGAAALGQLLATPSIAGRIGALLEAVVLALACAAVTAVLAFEIFTVKFALLGLPLAALLASAIVVRARRAGAPERVRPLGAALADALCLLAGFLAINAAWLAYVLAHLGLAGFGREVLLLGAGVERIYALLYPEPSPWALVAVALAIGAALLPTAIERGWIARRGLAALAVCVAIGVLAALATSALAPEGLVISVAMQLENLSFFVLPAVLAGAVLLWLRGARQPIATIALIYALLLFIQVYPRIDFMHVVVSMPSALVIVAGALWRVERRWAEALGVDTSSEDGARRLRHVRAVALVPIALALLARAAPLAEARLRLDPELGLRPMTALGMKAMPVSIERDRDHDLRELRRVAAFVERESEPGDPILIFPALAILPYLTDRRTTGPHDYFFSGRPSHADEAQMLEQIAAAPPPLAVTLNDRLGYFSGSSSYYFLLREYVRAHYTLVRRIGRYDILLRRDLGAARPHLAEARLSGGPLSAAFAAGEYRREVRAARRLARSGAAADLDGSAERLADVDRLVRRARLHAIIAVAERTPGGLAAVEPIVAPDRRSRLLFLRALGEFGNAKALAYLRQVYAEGLVSDARVEREAATSINYILARELTARYGWSRVEEGPLWSLPPDLLDDRMVGRLSDYDARQRIGALVALSAAAANRADLSAALEPVQHPRDAAWWRMTAALALVKLGRPEYLGAMMASMEEGTFSEQFVPSLLLDPVVVDPRLATALVADLLRSGTPRARETSAWMAPYLAFPVDAEILRATASDPDPAVRSAALWAIAEAERRRGLATGKSVVAPIAPGESH